MNQETTYEASLRLYHALIGEESQGLGSDDSDSFIHRDDSTMVDTGGLSSDQLDLRVDKLQKESLLAHLAVQIHRASR